MTPPFWRNDGHSVICLAIFKSNLKLHKPSVPHQFFKSCHHKSMLFKSPAHEIPSHNRVIVAHTLNTSSKEMICSLLTAPLQSATTPNKTKRRTMCALGKKKLRPQDPILNMIEAIDDAHQSAIKPTTKYRTSTTHASLTVVTVDLDDSDVSSIGSEEDEDEMFLCAPSWNGLPGHGEDPFLTPIIIDSMSSFSLTPRKMPEAPLLLSMTQFSPLRSTMLPPLQTTIKRKRQVS